MADPIERATTEEQKAALSKVRELMGSITQSRKLQEIIPGFKTQKGIYKPGDSNYALWIRQTVKGKYPDREPDIYPDGSWSYEYMPEAKNGKTDLSLSTNRSLLNCMNDRVPIGVFIQREIPDIQRAYQVALAYQLFFTPFAYNERINLTVKCLLPEVRKTICYVFPSAASFLYRILRR